MGVEERETLQEQFLTSVRQECGTLSRGLQLANSTFGDNALELLSAQKILCYALALLKLWQDDSNISFSGWLCRFDRQSTIKTFVLMRLDETLMIVLEKTDSFFIWTMNLAVKNDTDKTIY